MSLIQKVTSLTTFWRVKLYGILYTFLKRHYVCLFVITCTFCSTQNRIFNYNIHVFSLNSNTKSIYNFRFFMEFLSLL